MGWRKCLSLILSAMLITLPFHTSACYSVSRINNIDAINQTAAERKGYLSREDFCASIDIHTTPTPYLFYLNGECIEIGFGNINPNPGLALSEYSTAARCGQSSAIEALRRLHVEVPPLTPIQIGTHVFPTPHAKECGYEEDLTAVGWLVWAPIILVGSILVVPLGLIFLPLCAITAPFHSNRCM